jgi:hypothetical protein
MRIREAPKIRIPRIRIRNTGLYSQDDALGNPCRLSDETTYSSCVLGSLTRVMMKYSTEKVILFLLNGLGMAATCHYRQRVSCGMASTIHMLL